MAGSAFKKNKKFYIPFKIIGEPLQSRSTVVSYLMNLEMIKISKDIDKNFDFETIWPFILYLLNHWVRHQVRLMGIIETKPEFKKRFAKSDAQMYEVKNFDSNIKEA
jgi:hypothetical protein